MRRVKNYHLQCVRNLAGAEAGAAEAAAALREFVSWMKYERGESGKVVALSHIIIGIIALL